MKSLPRLILFWLGLGALAAGLAALSFRYADVPVARFFLPVSRPIEAATEELGSLVVISLEAGLILVLALIRLMCGRLPPLAKLFVVASAASMCAYAVNASVFKVIFGVAAPMDVMRGATHAVRLMQGDRFCSFPSGHMVLTCAFAGPFMRVHPRSLKPLAVTLALVAALLLAGNWHFISDIIMGSFFGLTVGLLAGELWLRHLETGGVV